MKKLLMETKNINYESKLKKAYSILAKKKQGIILDVIGEAEIRLDKAI